MNERKSKSITLDCEAGNIELEYIPNIYVIRVWNAIEGKKMFLTEEEILKLGKMIKEITNV